MFEAKVIEHSLSAGGGKELITFQLRYPRLVHAEFMTHRVFSRNASSSRAIPVAKVIEQVRSNPAMPVHWGKNQPGMQARAELEGVDLIAVKQLWRAAAANAAAFAEVMMNHGAHKQVANRILEPYQWMSVIVTATEWDNFYELRDHADADPNIQHLAHLMKEALKDSVAVLRAGDGSDASDWHLPYVTMAERRQYQDQPRLLAKVSGGRCARVSYLNHDGTSPVFEKDLGLYEQLVGSRPLHASPVEHQGYPAIGPAVRSGNFTGWIQHRKLVEAEVWGVADEPTLNTEDAA